jgi:hypothetical protein
MPKRGGASKRHSQGNVHVGHDGKASLPSSSPWSFRNAPYWAQTGKSSAVHRSGFRGFARSATNRLRQFAQSSRPGMTVSAAGKLTIVANALWMIPVCSKR